MTRVDMSEAMNILIARRHAILYIETLMMPPSNIEAYIKSTTHQQLIFGKWKVTYRITWENNWRSMTYHAGFRTLPANKFVSIERNKEVAC
jgi:hypothetical protein